MSTRRMLGKKQSAGISVEIPTSGLIHYWKLNNNANDEIGSNHGTVVGGTYETFSGADKYLFLDGVNDYMDLQLAESTITLPITLGAWCKQLGGTQTPDNSYQMFHKILFNYNGNAYARLGGGGFSRKDINFDKPETLGDVTDEWKLFLLKINSFTDIVYKVNNELGTISLTSGSGVAGIFGGTTRFGRWWGLANPFLCNAGEMFLYNKITSEAEDLQIWNRYNN